MSLIHKPYSPRRRCSLYTPGKVDKILPVLTKTDAAATIIIGRVVPKKDADLSEISSINRKRLRFNLEYETDK